MKSISVAIAGLCAGLCLPCSGWAAIDPAAAVIQLRQSCVSGAAPQNNCFTTTAALNDWMWKTRNPTAARPLTVEIGAGTFDRLSCVGPNRGHVTFRGVGRDQPAPAATATTLATQIRAGHFRNCVALVFENIAFVDVFDPGIGDRLTINAPVPSAPAQSTLHLSYGSAGAAAAPPVAADTAAQSLPSAEQQQTYDQLRNKLYDPGFTQARTLDELARLPELETLPPGLRRQLVREAMGMLARGELSLRAPEAGDSPSDSAQR